MDPGQEAQKTPPRNISEALYLLEAIHRLKQEIEQAPEPNEGRLGELKESIRNGTLVNDEVIQEIAAKMARIFIGNSEP